MTPMKLVGLARRGTKLTLVEELVISSCEASSYEYATVTGPFPLGEPKIATSGYMSLKYAQHVLKGRFSLGEPKIIENAIDTYYYAADVVKGRFRLGENIISVYGEWAFYYARDVLKGRFEIGEKAISESINANHYKLFVGSLSK